MLGAGGSDAIWVSTSGSRTDGRREAYRRSVSSTVGRAFGAVDRWRVCKEMDFKSLTRSDFKVLSGSLSPVKPWSAGVSGGNRSVCLTVDVFAIRFFPVLIGEFWIAEWRLILVLSSKFGPVQL